MNKYLFVISNHPVNKWDEKQKNGWEDITHIPFPNIPPNWSRNEVRELAYQYAKVLSAHIKDKTGEKIVFSDGKIYGTKSKKVYDNIYISIQGEFTFTMEMFKLLKVDFIFPTTERKTIEIDNKTKRQIFEFVRWR